MASTIQEIYVTGLRNAHALEVQAIQLLQRQAERLENYPQMEARIREHIEESRNQSARLEDLLRAHGTSESTFKDMMTGLMGNVAAMAHAPMQDEVLKNTFANFAFEHYEIASYKALLQMAEAAGDAKAPAALRQSLDEEVRMAQWIEQNMPETLRTYMQLETAGKTSGR
ncbi:ferritin-like domain-containing protein [Siccirubricoccus sp. KC 17139]|uniref:Ferritin-like domain-containing protein n=1 Tax=Siccirubricoccus soli TaxID=2899147 RepID=A0ABT1DAJ8_9PROT|nr:ferritin-like domain-containing protein [Siccirubricoccus soli]MCO6418214.1 ferritin-like domain-containing protein [Siccirubricoccus soli]MCP2684349.1 ferritin-like domain-containing protein [Siccirubricoccus soli]